MADGSRTTTPPMAIVKEEEPIAPVLSPNRAAPGAVALAAASSVSSLLDTELSPDLELPLRFRPILEDAIRTQPELVKKRYDEFREVERRAASKTAQNSSQVKLYASPHQPSSNQIRTRIHMPQWAERYISAERQT